MLRRFAWLASIAVSSITAAEVRAQTSEPIVLPRDPALSPDGKVLVFSWAGDLWAAPSTGGAATQLTRDPADDSRPAFSPDGKWIAFNSTRAGSAQVFVMPAQGGAAEQRTFHSEGSTLDGWYPDGTAFLTRGSRDHAHRPAGRFLKQPAFQRGAELVLFDDYGSDGDLSHDGAALLFTREDTSWFRKGYHGSQASQVWRFDVASARFTEVLHDELGFRTPLWKPDGSGFYYVGQQDGTFDLWECDRDGNARKQLTKFDDDAVMMPCIARDGSVIVFRQLFDFWRYEPGSGKAPEKLTLVNAGETVGSKWLRRTLDAATDVAFTEDGLEIAFVAAGDVYVMDTELKEPKRVTATPELESDVMFTKDAQALLFVSEQGGQSDVWRAERENADAYWWQNDRFITKRITEDTTSERGLRLSPDGTKVALVRGRGDLSVMDDQGRDLRRIVPSAALDGFDWSPDSKWIVYASSDDDFNDDVWIVPLDGSRPPFNVSAHPDNDGDPCWSPDGKVIAFNGRRDLDEVDVHYVYLARKDYDADDRDRKLDKALEKMKKGREEKKKDAKPEGKDDAKAEQKADAKPEAKKDEGEKKKDGEGDARKDDKDKDKTPEVVIDFDGLQDRVVRVGIPDSFDGNLFFVDEAKLAFEATIDGKRGLYAISFPDDTKPKSFSAAGFSGGHFSKKTKSVYGRKGGTPATLDKAGSATEYAFRTPHEVKTQDRYRAGFDVAWRLMRDNYYDDRLGNRNWDAVRRKYVDTAAIAKDGSMFGEVVSLMLGELNGSHLGFSSMEGGRAPTEAWRDVTAHLGLRFDPQWKGPGLKVKDVVRRGPTADVKSLVSAGEVVLAIDGVTVDPSLDLTLVLNGPMERDIKLRVRNDKNEERDVIVRPTTFAAVRRQLYEQWIDDNEKVVHEASGGKLGYFHIEGMDFSSFWKFEQALYRVGAGREGLLIDVRGNGGGSTADHLLTALTQPEHAIAVGRGGGPGYPQDRRVYASWSKPIVVLCDQNSFSNAEIFTHAIQVLHRGRVVGVPTAGGVISTGAAMVMDLGLLRQPFRGWYRITDGQDQELNGAVPDFVLWNSPGEVAAGRDAQLRKAIEVGLEDVKAWEARSRPALKKASER
jgi:tricorn protease